MIRRLGNVLFWLSVTISVAWLARGAWRAASFIYEYEVLPTVSVDDVVLIAGIPSVIVGIGWSIRYILAGRDA
jgi:hypothetical protein